MLSLNQLEQAVQLLVSTASGPTGLPLFLYFPPCNPLFVSVAVGLDVTAFWSILLTDWIFSFLPLPDSLSAL
jgi:hypothetical protein